MFGVKNMIQFWFCFGENRVVRPLKFIPLFSLERIIRHNLALIKLSLHQVTICLAKMTQKQTDYDGSQRKNLKYTQRNGSQIFRRRTLTKKSYFWLILRGNLQRKTPLLRFKWAFHDKKCKIFMRNSWLNHWSMRFWRFFSFVWTTGC